MTPRITVDRPTNDKIIVRSKSSTCHPQNTLIDCKFHTVFSPISLSFKTQKTTHMHLDKGKTWRVSLESCPGWVQQPVLPCLSWGPFSVDLVPLCTFAFLWCSSFHCSFTSQLLTLIFPAPLLGKRLVSLYSPNGCPKQEMPVLRVTVLYFSSFPHNIAKYSLG